jgi:hypothetical protein
MPDQPEHQKSSQVHYSRPHHAGEATSFDELAKGLASGTLSRGKALRLLGGALVGATLASVPGVAWAKKKPGKQKKCKDFEDCQGTIQGSECIKGQCVCGSGTTLCGGSCCTTEFCCGGVNGVCCGAPNTTCVNGECVCSPGSAACEGGCCPEGDICVDRYGGGKRCCDPGKVCGGICCQGYFDDHVCCNGVCCVREGDTCVNGQCGCGTGPSCPAGTECVPGTGTCCPEDQWCATDFSATNAICCPEGTVCTGDCSSHSQTCVTECCPVERVCRQGFGKGCCPEGTSCQIGDEPGSLGTCV